MLKRRMWINLAYLLFGIFTWSTLWQFLQDQAPPVHWPLETVFTVYKEASNYSYPIDSLPLHDYTQLMNLSFSFNILNPVDNDVFLILIVLVHSAPENFVKRAVIRETWGRETDNGIKVVFAVGSVVSKQVQKNLEEENRKHKDLVQGNFIDAYRNMTYKHVMVLKYVIYHCPNAKYILKTDDDIFVNMPSMRVFLTEDLSPYGATKLLCCCVKKVLNVIRSYRSKWRVSFSDYPHKKYPRHCPGWALLYSPDVVFNLYRAAQTTDGYFWIDDIYITGILAQKERIIHTDVTSLRLNLKEIADIVHSRNFSDPFLLGWPNLSGKTIKTLWKFVITHPVPKSVLKSLKDN